MSHFKTIFTLILMLPAFPVYPQSIEWVKKADMPIRISKAKAAVVKGKIYVIGGVSPDIQGFSNVTLEYDPDTDTWTRKADMPTGRSNFAMTSVDDKIYAIGGDPFHNKVEVYDPATDVWDSVQVMPSKRQHITCASVDNKIYVIGGFENKCCPPFPERCDWSSCARITDKNQVYNVSKDTWEIMAPIPTLRHAAELISVDGKIYIIGGMGTEKSIWESLDVNEQFDPQHNTWSTKKNMPYPRDGFGHSVQGSKIFIFGGWIGENQHTVQSIVYDTKTNSWDQTTQLPVKTGAFACATIDNKVYIFGGDKEDYSEIFSFTYVGIISK